MLFFQRVIGRITGWKESSAVTVEGSMVKRQSHQSLLKATASLQVYSVAAHVAVAAAADDDDDEEEEEEDDDDENVEDDDYGDDGDDCEHDYVIYDEYGPDYDHGKRHGNWM